MPFQHLLKWTLLLVYPQWVFLLSYEWKLTLPSLEALLLTHSLQSWWHWIKIAQYITGWLSESQKTHSFEWDTDEHIASFSCIVFVHCCASGEQTEFTNWIFLEKLAIIFRLNILLQKGYTDQVNINQILCIPGNRFTLSWMSFDFSTCVILLHNCLWVGLPYGTHKGLILECVRLLNQLLLTQERDTMIN